MLRPFKFILCSNNLRFSSRFNANGLTLLELPLLLLLLLLLFVSFFRAIIVTFFFVSLTDVDGSVLSCKPIRSRSMSTGAAAELLGAEGALDFFLLMLSDVIEPSVLYPDSFDDLGGGPRDLERDRC